MKNDIKGLSLRLSEGYRAARRLNSILCAITLAWSAAQFDIKTLSMKYIGSNDFSRASIPVILICTIAYTTTRCVLEFAMLQSGKNTYRFYQQ